MSSIRDQFKILPYRGRPQFGQNFRRGNFRGEKEENLGTTIDLMGAEEGRATDNFQEILEELTVG